MLEFTTVSASSYDPAALATKLTEKSAEGWTVVSIVSTGGDVTAFLSKGAGAVAAAPAAEAAAAEVAAPAAAVAATATAAAAAEPAGWGTAPEAAAPAAEVAAAPAAAAPAAAAPAAAAPAAAAPTPAIPADWYADPSGRFELRYWNGSAWTEHVARAGQQYTDPPVA